MQAMKNRTKKIFVGGVPTDMEEQTLKDYFIKFGEVSDLIANWQGFTLLVLIRAD